MAGLWAVRLFAKRQDVRAERKGIKLCSISAWSELLIIAIVMIVVVGPKDLPKMLRAFGKATARMRTTANEFRHQFNEALKEAELEDVKTIIDEARSLDPRTRLTQVFDSDSQCWRGFAVWSPVRNINVASHREQGG